MGIHMNLDYHEPPNGDFVRLIDRMVGSPPTDPEIAGKEITARLTQRAKLRKEQNEQTADTMYGDVDLHRPIALNGPTAGPPDVGDALRSLAGGGVRALFNGISKLLILVGLLILATTGFMGMDLPIVEPLHGIVALIGGIFVNNATS